MNYYLDVIKKYAVFSGRASRKEYWMFFLANTLVGLAMVIVLGALRFGAHLDLFFLVHLYGLALFCPNLGVTIRRLHDCDRTGWCWLVAFIPLVGAIVLLILLAQKGSEGDNRFGPPVAGAITTSA